MNNEYINITNEELINLCKDYHYQVHKISLIKNQLRNERILAKRQAHQLKKVLKRELNSIIRSAHRTYKGWLKWKVS